MISQQCVAESFAVSTGLTSNHVLGTAAVVYMLGCAGLGLLHLQWLECVLYARTLTFTVSDIIAVPEG